jgi:hypothetical protein
MVLQAIERIGSRINTMTRLQPAALLVFVLSILFYFFFDYCKHAPMLGAANPFAEDPYDAVGSFGIQLAFVSAVAMGLLLILAEAVAEGTASSPGRMLLVVGVYVSLEGAGVVLGYLLFGKYLGIFRAE